jgi:hypothetical protein
MGGGVLWLKVKEAFYEGDGDSHPQGDQ